MDELLKAIALANLEQKVLLLPQFLEYEKKGIEFLIGCLCDRELAIREKAYQLLKDIKDEKAQKATALGLLLNPGDKIYSVYEAGIWFTDESYLLFDGVDYLIEIYIQVYGDRNFDEGDEMCQSKRKYCYINKTKAEQKAETIHRNSLAKHSIGDICGFYWERKNPDLDLKSWCLENNLLSNQEWNDLPSHQREWRIEKLIGEYQDKTLIDRYKRSKYIYHLDFVDEWLRENQVNYNYDYEDWDNLFKLLEYLELPENIELLSKFWKDGVGDFAFVREEIVQQESYVTIEEKLSHYLLKDRANNKLIAKPENYAEQAINYLIEILEHCHSKPKHKLKAYQLLYDFDTDAAKQFIAKGIEGISVESMFELGEEIDLNSIRLSWDGNPS
ncbi:MAG: hypothetical protein ACFCAD_13080 [Pleurocapsa sp.]